MISTVVAAAEFRAFCDHQRASGRRIGFVPTMGALHDGHLALVRAAKAEADVVVASVFVNPTQFGPNEDFSKYPRDLDGDRAKLASAGCDLVFAPTAAEMYPTNDVTRVRVAPLEAFLCGPIRPGHFEGVATVVSKFFHLVGPATAVFGRKDYQQLAVLRAMVRDLFLPITIVGHPIVREADGLAMSSRNAYLTPAQRHDAQALSQGLAAAQQAFAQGARDADELAALVTAPIAAVADSIDYVSVADADTLAPLTGDVGDRALLAIAARFGGTRLLDNVVLGEDAPLGRADRR